MKIKLSSILLIKCLKVNKNKILNIYLVILFSFANNKI